MVFSLNTVFQCCHRSGEGQGKIIHQGQGYVESGKVDRLKKSQGKLNLFNLADLIPFKARRNIWGH